MGQARVIAVIQTDDLRGDGTHTNPYRRVEQFYSLDGELLWERDGHMERLREERSKVVTENVSWESVNNYDG